MGSFYDHIVIFSLIYAGTNENLNGLLRQYLPKRISLAGLTQRHCDALALRLNTRPRKRLGYRTPEECFNER